MNATDTRRYSSKSQPNTRATAPRDNRVLMVRLVQRTSARGTVYLTGWLGRARLVGFMGEPDEQGNAVWDIYCAEPAPRQEEKAPANTAAHRQDDRERGRYPAYHRADDRP